MVLSVIHTKPKEGKYLFIAFPTVGYIAVLAVNYLIHKKMIKEVGYIDLQVPEQVALIEEGKITYPVRIFEGEQGVFVTTQFPIDLKYIDEITSAIFEVYGKIKAKGIVTLDALNVAEEKPENGMFYVSNRFDQEIKNAKPLQEGVMLGLNANIALQARKQEIPFLAFLAEAHTNIPDGAAAAKLVEALNQITGAKVDTTELLNEYKIVLSNINKLLEKAKQSPEKKSEIYG